MEAVRAALADRQWSEAVKQESSIIHRFAESGWDRVQVFSTSYQPEVIGLSIAEIAKSERCQPWEAIRRLLDATDGDVHNVMVVCDSYDEADIVNTAKLSGCLVGSDATTLCPDGPLADSKFLGAYTWAAWLYSKLTSGPDRITPEKAVAKLAGEPARRFGLGDRGTIATGKKADVVVFDPERFGTEATMLNPNVLATGVRHVVVNGAIAMRDGLLTGAKAGRVVRGNP
jgi:N-acyl-D-aspartate/D-glutamate deacylase